MVSCLSERSPSRTDSCNMGHKNKQNNAISKKRHKCQRQCSQKNASYKSKAGDEHWTKYLQASEENQHLLLDGSGGMLSIQHTCSCARTGSSSSAAGKPHKDNIFSSLYNRFTDWIASKRDSVSHTRGGLRHTCRHRKAKAERPSDFKHDFPVLYPHSNGLSPGSFSPGFSICHSPVSSQCSDYDSLHLASSTCSDFTVISTPSVSGCHTPNIQYYSSANSPNGVLLSPNYRNYSAQEFVLNYPDFVQKLFEWQRTFLNNESTTPPDQSEQTTWHSHIGNGYRKRLHSETRKLERQKSAPLWKTWPSIEDLTVPDRPADNTTHNCDVIKTCSQSDDVRRLGAQNRTDSQQSEDRKDPLTEFSIAYGDLQFNECVRKGNTRDICTGKWHGDVLIHCYHDVNEEERCNFWRTVSQLGKIRHENVVLYMGACLEEPNFAVVTSIRKGISLYEHIHIKGEKNNIFSSLHVARQISQAMGYLHAKGVVVQTLCSRNVNLEPKVKLCLMDHSFPETQHKRQNLATLPRGNLSYYAPELLRSAVIDKQCLVTQKPYTEMSDVFAFGTLLYELSTGKFPLCGTPPDCMIYQVCNGKRACLNHITVKHVVKTLIRKCWSHEPMKRPGFEDINDSLQQHGSMHKKQSSSDPESLHKTGLHSYHRNSYRI